MNLGIFVGRLTRDSSVTTTQSGIKMARNTLAVDRGKDKEGNDRGADFIPIIGYGYKADFLEKYGTKGRRFAVKTHVVTGNYTNKDGVKVYTTDFVLDEIEFADSKPSGEQAAVPENATGDEFMQIPEELENELPFN